jgi:DNA-binding protein
VARAPDDKTVYIGRKPRMTYVIAASKQLNDAASVILKARGKSISQAVDVAEIVRRRYIKDATVDDIQIATEFLEGEDGDTANVSSIQIFMSRPLMDDGSLPPPVDLFAGRDRGREGDRDRRRDGHRDREGPRGYDGERPRGRGRHGEEE